MTKEELELLEQAAAEEKGAATTTETVTETATATEATTTEPTEEKPTETTATTTEATTEAVEETAEKTEDDVINEIASQTLFETPAVEEKKPEPKAETATTEIPQEIQAKVTEYDSLMSDPEIAWAIAAKREGKSIVEALKDALPVDTSKLTVNELFEIDLKNISQYMTEEDIEDARKEFESLSKYEQIKKVQSVREALERQNEEKQRAFKVDPEKAKQDRLDAEKDLKTEEERIAAETATLLNGLKDKTVFGLKVDDKIFKQVADYLYSEECPAIYKKDGKPDIQAMIELSFNRTQFKNVLAANLKKKIAEEKINMLEERRNVNLNTGSGTGKVVETNTDEADRMIREAFPHLYHAKN